ncbi:MAG: phenylacetic acid degradation protein, partial [Candidatus Eremiobacteraeota bacterium]|nr:phenylacetic acid degradation protein [Candidatus Eremiobacteraeota bacterium]
MDTDASNMLERLREVSATSAVNRWLGFDLVSASAGEVEMHLPWRDEFGQYSGFLHAGVV